MAELTENLIRLRTAPGVGNAIIWRLLREFGDADRVFGASLSELTKVKGITSAKAGLILQAAAHDPRPEMEKAVAAGIDIIPYDDQEYPKALLHTFDPPVVLYVRGRLTQADQISIAMVGTRQASPYGREYALSIASSLSRAGYTIVSGLARGIDTFAHIGALNAAGRTIGVLGCGFDHMYPAENRDLALEMTKNGAVISEFSMATPPSRETFPIRNRIIAGMSLGLVVVEAPLRSGSLITARLANEIGRSVFAVPGRVGDAFSEGCNQLIRDGAVMVMSVDDILNELNPQVGQIPSLPPPARPSTATKPRQKTIFPSPDTPPPATPKLSPEQETMLKTVGREWSGIDELIQSSGLSAGQAAASLSMLKIMRLVEQGPGQTYRCIERHGT